MSTVDIPGLEFDDQQYTVEQSMVRNKYKAMDSRGNVVLRGKQKLFRMKEEFPFEDGSGNDAFTVKADSRLDIAGNYTLYDPQTEQPIVVLDNDFSIFQDTWRIRDAGDGSEIAQINSRGALVTLFRELVPFGELLPHKYEITDSRGQHVGNIDGQFSMRDRYDITIDDASDVPTDAVVAAAMVIDAIQGN